ncbi:tubulin tyrosine ligase protein [Strigomonas culicis]|uniref:Tubulin--tyrosine ligase-like protein 9 n=1 Tax=Strigomonas culicis TaxID=28005 RepID=S9UA69_9TRYP|nr:tubulin tyrosine ligase protein [Strigomonas culicis]|eukprot:EPY25853.1 tubulin tyrosine ligase protein [Strigomonas culicis]
MVKNFKKMRKSYEKEGNAEEVAAWDFFPVTYSLPHDYGLFEQEFKRNPNAIWIMKPPAKAQGKGIFLFSKLSQIAEWKKEFNMRVNGYTGGATRAPANTSAAALLSQTYGVQESVEPYLAQRYIHNPHLVGGKKYDLRIYVLVTSYHPLTVWLHRTGFARFCHQRYSLDDIDNTFIHVTNVAVQKTNPKYTAMSGCKFGIRNLRTIITAAHGADRAKELFEDIQMMILRTIFSVERIMINDAHCTELYGYDVMIDDQLHPWLIETNASPSLTAETPADYHLKFNMLEDMFNIIDLEKRRQGDERRVGGFDLIWANGPVSAPPEDRRPLPRQPCHLGCANELEIPISVIRMPRRLQDHSSSERLLT